MAIKVPPARNLSMTGEKKTGGRYQPQTEGKGGRWLTPSPWEKKREKKGRDFLASKEKGEKGKKRRGGAGLVILFFMGRRGGMKRGFSSAIGVQRKKKKDRNRADYISYRSDLGERDYLYGDRGKKRSAGFIALSVFPSTGGGPKATFCPI